MPVLPIIDLLLLMGWTCLAVGGIMKAISITTNYRPEILSFRSFEFYELAGIFLLFAIALAARTWVKAHEPEMLAKRRRVSTLHAVSRANEESELASDAHSAEAHAEPELPARDLTGF